jgi:ABC-2 type transport system ATP-binding protein
MILVKNVSKSFNSVKAVDNISFTLKKGEITGFLGPNGAGKTTTMRLLTGFFFPNSGEIKIDGRSYQEDASGIKSKIGYLPENNPLYQELKVREYLEFIAQVRQLDQIPKRIGDVAKECGLTDYLDSKIEILSKGYKQRVGLAQSLIHDPEILIMDEPTSGLDPNQIVEIRKLIKKLGKKKTVILSTHILSEVQAICSQVIIINRGKIVADDSLAKLTKGKKSLEKVFLRLTLE